jgi:hypothetical protein
MVRAASISSVIASSLPTIVVKVTNEPSEIKGHHRRLAKKQHTLANARSRKGALAKTTGLSQRGLRRKVVAIFAPQSS